MGTLKRSQARANCRCFQQIDVFWSSTSRSNDQISSWRRREDVDVQDHEKWGKLLHRCRRGAPSGGGHDRSLVDEPKLTTHSDVDGSALNKLFSGLLLTPDRLSLQVGFTEVVSEEVLHGIWNLDLFTNYQNHIWWLKLKTFSWNYDRHDAKLNNFAPRM